ncbi:hypothetical protein BDY17DRAFT_298113 [Neohortaea acidophila]|uniref:Uncharacterized protein n=1 Tax=Neohortaea acidophila TaxID=245834 RepID=A0A6A6PRC6_9PEZI|nr:uncharacterized protein BDY17DRAFT_298113 [Neohortaea acidophila]KAF2482204.1 hypothetical protein BDY17DRAFT_298113 [Neohortaea acidophila]
MDALSTAALPSYTPHRIPNLSHRKIMSLRNARNSTTMTVTLSGSINAGNMNNTLFPAPNCSASASYSNRHCLRFKSVFSSLICRLSPIALDISMLSRAYINPATCGECAACSSAASPIIFSFCYSAFLSPSSP